MCNLFSSTMQYRTTLYSNSDSNKCGRRETTSLPPKSKETFKLSIPVMKLEKIAKAPYRRSTVRLPSNAGNSTLDFSLKSVKIDSLTHL